MSMCSKLRCTLKFSGLFKIWLQGDGKLFGVAKNIMLVFPKEGNLIAFMNANVAVVASCVRTRLFLEMPV